MREPPVTVLMVSICCDQCDQHGIDIDDEGELNGAFDPAYFDNELRQAGWRIDETGDTCPFCLVYETLFLGHLDGAEDAEGEPEQPAAQADLFATGAAE